MLEPGPIARATLPPDFVTVDALLRADDLAPRRADRVAAQAKVGATRAFRRSDIPRVTELFLDTFRAGAATRWQTVADAIEATYFGSPAYTSETGSIVHCSKQGRVDGFLGVIPMTLGLHGRRLKGGVLSTLMADRSSADPQIGAALFRATRHLPLDVVFTDSANRTSLEAVRPMRSIILPACSLEWTKPLRPLGIGAYALTRRRPRLRTFARAVAGVIDARLPATALTAIDSRRMEGTSDRAITGESFVARASSLLPTDGLRPAWTDAELSWLLEQAALRTRNGALQMREVLDRGGRTIGLYLLYAEPGNAAFALQVLSRGGREGEVVGNLLVRAEALGSVAVRGASSPAIIEGLLRQPGVLYRNVMSVAAYSADAEIAAALRIGHATLGGLAGDTWTRIFADEFSR